MSNTPSPTRPSAPARLALSLRDPGSSGLVNIADLRAEPLPLSLVSAGLTSTPPPAPAPRPSRSWTMAVLGSAVGLTAALVAMVFALEPAPTVIVEKPVAIERQMSMQEVEAAPVLTAEQHDEPAPTEAQAEPAPTEAESERTETSKKATKKTTRKRNRSKAKTKTTKTKTAKTKTTTTKSNSGGSSIPLSCVLDPASCDAGGSPKAGGSSKTGSPKALPAKLSATQLKAALAGTKASARACGPKHGAPAGTRVKVKLSIEGKTGGVVSASAQGEHAGTSLGACVASALDNTTFPRFTAARMGTIYTVRL